MTHDVIAGVEELLLVLDKGYIPSKTLAGGIEDWRGFYFLQEVL